MIPEYILYNLLKGILIHLRRDIQTNSSDLSKTMLREIFPNTHLNSKYDYFTQAIDLFGRQDGENSPITITMGYPNEIKFNPHIAIINTNTSPKNNQISLDSGEYDDTDPDSFTPIFTRTFDGTLSCMITSNNMTESTLIYYTLESMLISIMNTVEFEGLINPSISGKDFKMDDGHTPVIFGKTLTVSFLREVKVRRFFSEQDVSNIIFEGKMTI